MASEHNCTRLMMPCNRHRIDPCDCRYYYECSPQAIVRRCCAEGAVFNAKTMNCFFASLKICDINKPWTRCRLDDFGIAKDQIQSVATCRKYWPEEMKNWNMTLRKGTTERNKVTTMSTDKSKKTTRWSIGTNYRPVSNVTVVRPTGTGDDIQPSRVPVTEQVDFDTPAAKTYIPVIVFGMIALVAFVAIIILWKKRSDVKAFVAGLCCVGGEEKSKAICNPGYGNTIAVCDPRLDQTTGEHVYHEIPCLNPASVVNRPLPQTPQQQQQTVRASTLSGFGCPDVAIRKEQQQIQRTNSACQTYDKLTSREDRRLIDAQERFANEYQVSSANTHPKNMSARAPVSGWKSQTSEQQTADITKPGRNRGHHINASDRKDSHKVNGIGRHRTNSGKLCGIKEDLELSTPTINAADSAKISDSESISASGNSQSSLRSEKNNPNFYSGVWNGVSISGKTRELKRY